MWSSCLLDLGTVVLFGKWSFYRMRSILQKHLISMACFLLCNSAVRVHDSQVYRKMDVIREHIRRSLELREMLLSLQSCFNLFSAAVISWRVSLFSRTQLHCKLARI